MINLLPAETKQSYRYARRNRTLLHWLGAMVASVAGAIVLTGGGYLYLHQSVHNYTQQVTASNKLLATEKFTSVEKQVKDISNNLKLVNQVLSKEILFSDLLKQLGTVTPPNVVLTNLSIVQAQGAIDITAQTSSYDAATQLQINLADAANQIFSKADIVSIDCNGSASATGTVSQYPCTATIRALFATNNPFLFINSGAKAKS